MLPPFTLWCCIIALVISLACYVSHVKIQEYRGYCFIFHPTLGVTTATLLLYVWPPVLPVTYSLHSLYSDCLLLFSYDSLMSAIAE